ncbi:MAG TPA: 50S ribosomal protein L9 [Acidimicrobiales bacterium]|jgi:large subunit ribosomal protein L9|nr:50S ribosomal protein L9 [Acidimicrobiales bacterium]
MKLVLRSDVNGLGKRGDIVDVADGYARNHLIPAGRAIAASDGIEAQANSMRRSRDLKDAKDREGAEVVARKLVPMVIKIPARAGAEGRLFGSVTAQDVVEAVEEQAGVVLDRRRLVTDETIRSVGSHEIGVRLHPEVEFRITVEVVPAG